MFGTRIQRSIIRVLLSNGHSSMVCPNWDESKYQMSQASKRNEGRTTNHVEITDGPLTINLLGAWNGSYQYCWKGQNLGIGKYHGSQKPPRCTTGDTSQDHVRTLIWEVVPVKIIPEEANGPLCLEWFFSIIGMMIQWLLSWIEALDSQQNLEDHFNQKNWPV